MPIFLRRLVMWLFIISFFIITPLVIMKASGYSYNWKKGAFEKNGVLMIDIKPKSSDIFVNNEKLKQLFPFSAFHLEDLNPGKYNIRIEKENYHSWEKNVEVEANLTTFIDRVQLWPMADAVILEERPIDKWFYLNEQYSLYSNETDEYSELWLFNNEIKSSKLIYRFIDLKLSEEISRKNFKNSANNKFLAFQYNDENFIFNLLNPEDSKNLNSLYPQIKIENTHWDYNDDNVLYISDNKNNIYEARLDNENYLEKFYTAAENIVDFNIIDKHIYYINADKIFKRDNLEENKEEIILELKNTEYSIEEIDKEHWFIHNNDHSFFFQYYDNKLYYQEIPSAEITFSKDERKLAYVNPKQLDIVTLEKFKEQPEAAENYLLSRYSEAAKNLIWFTSGEYIFYQLGNNIEVIELDGRGNNRNINILYTSPNSLKGFSVDKNHEKLFVANEDGIYELVIQE